MTTPPEPTAEMCERHARFDHEGVRCLALWYPQMGGYVGKAVAYAVEDGCVEVWVWHDGEFPFSGDGDDRSPAHLHHCMPEQFIEFGKVCESLL